MDLDNLLNPDGKRDRPSFEDEAGEVLLGLGREAKRFCEEGSLTEAERREHQMRRETVGPLPRLDMRSFGPTFFPPELLVSKLGGVDPNQNCTSPAASFQASSRSVSPVHMPRLLAALNESPSPLTTTQPHHDLPPSLNLNKTLPSLASMTMSRPPPPSPPPGALTRGSSSSTPDPVSLAPRSNEVIATTPPIKSNPNTSKESASKEESMKFELRVSGPMDTVWYAGRRMTALEICLVDTTTAALASSISGWKIRLSATDGHGLDATAKLVTGKQSDNHEHTILAGKVVILGLRFTQVSSKSGGHFTIRAELISPATSIATVRPWQSEKLQVLSYRLYHFPKASNDVLTPTDKVAKMKGIGSMYAQRLGAVGLERVSHLAALNPTAISDQFLDVLRKDRGAMTKLKLQDYIRQAQEIVGRHNNKAQTKSK